MSVSVALSGRAHDLVLSDACCSRCGKVLHPSAGDWMFNDPVPAYLCASCANALVADYRSGEVPGWSTLAATETGAWMGR